MASRCSTLSRREVYVQDLKQFIDVDIFGDCGRPAPTKGSPPINIDFRTELGKISCGVSWLWVDESKSGFF